MPFWVNVVHVNWKNNLVSVYRVKSWGVEVSTLNAKLHPKPIVPFHYYNRLIWIKSKTIEFGTKRVQKRFVSKCNKTKTRFLSRGKSDWGIRWVWIYYSTHDVNNLFKTEKKLPKTRKHANNANERLNLAKQKELRAETNRVLETGKMDE